jgi:adenylate cyclase
MWNDFIAFIFGRPAQRQLPERVRAAIARQQVNAEILIGWTQFALVLFFLALYTIAPKPADGTLFHPVPWVLSAFLLFTLVRLTLAHRRIIATWFLAGSVVADIGLLLLLIWSFHIQYAQPAAFYLTAPTLLYVFLFIALRTLRFDPTYVIIAGVSAAVGWAVLVVLAATEPSLMPLITRDYILYLTSNRVLIGAEVDKTLCILIVTAVLAVAIIRARRLLMQAVADATVAHDLTRFVAPEVASQIAASERAIEPGDGEVLTASVLFCDIEGFSTISERLSPDELMQTLNEYFAAVSEVVDRYDGVLIAYQGDAMLIGFNTVRPDPDHAAHALSTAIGIQEMVDRRRFGDGLMLKTRCGINTGRLVAGAVGTPERLLFTVYGDEVNIAARLEQLNKSFGTYILATEQTLAGAGRGFACRPMGSVQVRGRSQPVTVFAVDGPALEEPSPATRLTG